MLTAKQIEAALNDVESTSYEETVVVVNSLATAYERVVAALDGLKRQRDMEPEGSMARLLLAGFCAVIEHALNGG